MVTVRVTKTGLGVQSSMEIDIMTMQSLKQFCNL